MEHVDIRLTREMLFLIQGLLHRCVMFEAVNDINTNLNFFRVYKGCLMDTICIDWCKVFGSDGNSSHWKHAIPPTNTESFRDTLKTALDDNDCDCLSKVWDTTKSYRDTAAAHLDHDEIKRAQKYPMIKPLRVTAEVLYKELYDQLEAVGAHSGFVEASGIIGAKRIDYVRHNSEIFQECLDSLDGWTNTTKP